MAQQLQHRARGFTLIELMVTVAIVGILMAVAIPAYSNYVLRARATEAFTALGAFQPAAEQYWANNRKYTDIGLTQTPSSTANFGYAVSGATDSAYLLTATGTNKMAGFAYTIDQSGNKKTTLVPTTPAFAGWTTSDTCWVDRKGGLCTQ
ncbi:MAG: prepilin-type N-terminal cleavage/methylation domain-containing protein [Pseudomonadota bacterium]|nr:prepilin-type N-terminal cleavage/methylation domain-containing protein [Pseudomonadota bacterium]